ncbi:PREDICTED: alpha/beta hydrolase domain-containing protein 11-like [Ceratosolen solmsi marchali]|uniref:sn-1-specific diacylglycerol lipase ABHD11 n=1 Tax=Ceratosolen solmsi marchali TaxID=326594 RepID=A0AAJ6YXH9_9HYME|nr:PREDICTED: alpha/beta hydrolase domain-containing protein 11-like [Ceratosolen solmsi marchali]
MILKKCTSRLYLLPRRLNTILLERGISNGHAGQTPVKLAYTSYESTKEMKESSPKSPILIMHGLFGSKSNWNSLSKSIHQQTNRKVIAIDARNHGDSPHASQMSYYHMTEDIALLLRDLEIKKVILVGHSMGGGAVMYTALNYPEIVEKIIVVDFSPIKTSPSLVAMIKLFEAMHAVSLDGILSLSKARKLADKQLSISIKSNPIRQFLLTNLVEAEPGKYKWRLNLKVLEDNFPTRIAVFPLEKNKAYNGPTLFIGGSESDYLKESDHSLIKTIFPFAKFQYITGAGHWVHADKPSEFLKCLTTFITD